MRLVLIALDRYATQIRTFCFGSVGQSRPVRTAPTSETKLLSAAGSARASTPPANRSAATDQAVGRWQLPNLAEPGVRSLLNRVQQLVAFDGHIEVGADWLSFANAFSHPYEELRNVEGRLRRHRGWNRAIALRYREIRQRFAICAPRTVNSEICKLVPWRGSASR